MWLVRTYTQLYEALNRCLAHTWCCFFGLFVCLSEKSPRKLVWLISLSDGMFWTMAKDAFGQRYSFTYILIIQMISHFSFFHLFLIVFIFILCIAWFACLCACVSCVHSACRDQKVALKHLELKLKMVVDDWVVMWIVLIANTSIQSFCLLMFIVYLTFCCLYFWKRWDWC